MKTLGMAKPVNTCMTTLTFRSLH